MSQAWTDPWQLVIEHQYEQAIDMYSQRYEDDGSPSHLVGRGTAHLLMGDPARALEDFRESMDLQEPRFQNATVFSFQGVCHWYMDQPNQAVAAWREVVTAPYADIAGGVRAPTLLLYAAERLDDSGLRREALALLHRHARRNLHMWPGPTVPFLLEKAGVVDLQCALGAVSVQLRQRCQCQFDFYRALRAFRSGDIAQFQGHVAQCASNAKGIIEEEYYLAR